MTDAVKPGMDPEQIVPGLLIEICGVTEMGFDDEGPCVHVPLRAKTESVPFVALVE